ncbi:RNA-binding protein Musashi homolog 1 isoform X1 [Lates japonicus]|uniref:RNA-binding protein Musashi homolog 1 isoform X1 n=1 Tax=Lates japonicus TaxID=270547 RepID=A0AAD3NNH6_LATJO|nr:RNA-binding protein Musashi homolog 1 isoform X1 [Lates japonicus]
MLNGQCTTSERGLEGHKHNVVRPTPIVSLQPLASTSTSPKTGKREGLKEYFCKFGEVKECMVMRDPVTKRSRGFGFVTYAEQAGVEKVLAQNRHELDSKTGANMKAFFLGLHCHGYLGDLNGVGAPAKPSQAKKTCAHWPDFACKNGQCGSLPGGAVMEVVSA